MKSTIGMTYKLAKRWVIAIVGATVLLIGLIMIVAPGPAVVMIPLGLAILSAEFAWARLFLKRIRRHISSQLATARSNGAENRRR